MTLKLKQKFSLFLHKRLSKKNQSNTEIAKLLCEEELKWYQ